MSVEDTVAATLPGASLVGTQLGAYRIERLLGEGAMGEVFLATHVALGRPVAIKTLKPHVAADRSLTERFFAEARAVNIIRHENIVECTDLVNDPGGRSYIVMELLEGKTLGAAIREAGRMPPRRAARIAAQIADAIGAAHDKGIVHRDLKPENVYLIRRAGSPDYVKVLDFGIARLRPELGGVAATQSGALIGTPAYMSPEQVRGDKAGPAADIYALGTITFHMLTGRLPFQETSLSMMLVAQLQETPPRVDAIAPEVPRSLADVIASALAKDPAARPASMAAFRQAVLEAAGLPVDPQASLVEAAPSAALPTGLEPTLPPVRSAEVPPAVTASSISGAASQVATPPRSAKPRAWVFIAAGVAMLGVAAIAIAVTRDDEPPATAAARASDDNDNDNDKDKVEVTTVAKAIDVQTPQGMSAAASAEWDGIVKALQAGRTVRARQRVSAWQQRYGETPESRDLLAQLDRVNGGPVVDEAGPTSSSLEVELRSVPPGATVYHHLTQRELCRTPCKQVVTAPTLFMLGLDGYKKGFINVEPSKGQRVHEVTLDARSDAKAPKAALGTAQIAATPPAQIWRDGKLLGRTPLNVQLPEGAHTLEAVGPEGDKQTFVVDVTAGKTSQYTLTMRSRRRGD